MTRVASLYFSKNPNVTEAQFDIYRRRRGMRELWCASSLGVESLPYPGNELPEPFETPLRYLAPRDPSDLDEFLECRGVERAVADLLRMVGADSACFVQIETEWFVYFEPADFCREISEMPLAVRAGWEQLNDRFLEDESATFCTLIPETAILERLKATGMFSLAGGVLEVPRQLVTELPIPAGAVRTGITIDSGNWVLLVGDPDDRLFVPFAVEWTAELEMRLVPNLPNLESDVSPVDAEGVEIRRFQTPSGPTLSFAVTEEYPMGEIRVESDLLPRPAYEQHLP